jgi:hypothetical protein
MLQTYVIKNKLMFIIRQLLFHFCLKQACLDKSGS